MLITEYTVETTADPQDLWSIWQDVTNWNTWDQNIEYSTINGPFTEGTSGILKPKEGPSVRIKITSIDPMTSFTCESKLPLCRIIVSHFLTVSKGKTKITHRFEIKGPLAFIFYHLIGHKIKKNLPEEMTAMTAQAENLKSIRTST